MTDARPKLLPRFVVDPALQRVLPPLKPEEYAQLKANIEQDGLRDKIVAWPQDDGTLVIVDGHNRKQIAEELGIQVEAIELPFANTRAARRWIIDQHRGRRNVDDFAVIEEFLESGDYQRLVKEAAARKRAGRPKASERTCGEATASSKERGPTVAQQAADATGTTEHAVKQAVKTRKLKNNDPKAGTGSKPKPRASTQAETEVDKKLTKFKRTFAKSWESVESNLNKPGLPRSETTTQAVRDVAELLEKRAKELRAWAKRPSKPQSLDEPANEEELAEHATA